jgi:hypothetical protein
MVDLDAGVEGARDGGAEAGGGGEAVGREVHAGNLAAGVVSPHHHVV